MVEFLTIKSGAKLFRFEHNDILYIETAKNYSDVHIAGSNKIDTFSIQIGEIADLIRSQLKQTASSFIRVGKSLIINRNYVQCIDVSNGKLELYCGVGRAIECDVFKYSSNDYDKDRKKYRTETSPEYQMRNTNIKIELSASREALIKLRDELLED